MTLGKCSRLQSQKRKQAALAAAFPQGIRCQKCLGYGHWSYECKGRRKILIRPSRTKIMKKNLETGDSNPEKKVMKKKKRCKSNSSVSDQGATDTTDGHQSVSSQSSSSSSSDSSDSDSASSDSSDSSSSTSDSK